MQRTLRYQHVITTIRRASTRRTAPQAKPPPRRPSDFQWPKTKAEKLEERVSKWSSRSPPLPPPPSEPPPPPPPSEKIALNKLTPSRAIPWALASLVAGSLGFYLGSFYLAANQPCTNPDISSLSAQKDVSARYDDTADSFDAEVGLSEVLMGVNSLRKRLVRQCKGHVLEVSCGTGRNLGYFALGPGSEVDSLTFVDLSPAMVEVCRRKWDVLVGGERDGVEKGKLRGLAMPKGIKRSLVVRFLTGSALEEMPAPPEIAIKDDEGKTTKVEQKKKYTTILQTMGLCSTPSPHALLSCLASHLDTSDPEARILLLEHGRSYTPWLNRILDNSAEKHAEVHGCWYNRDIGAIVEEEAEKAGLVVRRVRRHHLGTTWVFELAPGERLLAAKEGPEGGRGGEVRQGAEKSWWSFWK